VPAGLPFVSDKQTIQRGLNFTLITSVGAVELLGEIPGGRSYDQLTQDSIELS